MIFCSGLLHITIQNVTLMATRMGYVMIALQTFGLRTCNIDRPVKVVVGVWVLKARTLLRCIHKCCKISEKWPCVQLPPVDVDCVRYKTLESACCGSSSLLWQLFGLSDLAVGWLNLALGSVFDSCSYACLALCSFQCRRTLSSFRPVLACL